MTLHASGRSLVSRSFQARSLLAALAVLLGLLGDASARAQSYDLHCSLLPYPYIDNCFDDSVGNGSPYFTTLGSYGDRRVKFNQGNPHSTRVSYNLSYDYSIYEVTDIPLNDHVAHYFTTAHPTYFGGTGQVVVVRARNLGGDPIEPFGQVSL